ncbi:WS/DGAT/MGAT family O-acyltransferase [Mycolicibacterium hodleri]|uniref:Diacylglycerol O-acyltransferase n=1 Tax=Mycolicibacterium hodleri TaxID=49897 RepID=A0A502EHR7_9MYCO|nr:wax ester/triacylglycerol synthase family O-acyltransferase [Mycolicibacterium hodleri]TPG36582.1 wax ester/triacylglycerol synthase family O-acyltransferase [Mycolicibacterium hodleri]
MKRLSGWDAMMLYSETPNIHMHTIKVAVVDAAGFDGDYSFELFERTVRKRLPGLDPLRYQLVDIPFKFHHPMWLENVPVDLDFHVRRARVRSPGGRRELNQLIGELASTPLDRSRPLWEFHFVEGMAHDRFAVICKLHHALADGVASSNLLAKAMDPRPFASDDERPYQPDSRPSTSEMLREAGRDHVRQIARLPRLVKNTAGGVSRIRRRSNERDRNPALARNFRPPETFINHVVSPTRTFATATLAMADVKETKNALGITINDLVLAMAAGGLRELRLRYEGKSDQPIITSVAAATDTSPDRITGNRLSGIFVSLPVDVDDPGERVHLTKVGSGIAKEKYQLLGPEIPGRWSAYLPPPFAPFAFRRMAASSAQNKLFNLPISNVPGPRERGSISGAPMTEIYSVGPLMAGAGINITVWSYADQLNISVLADDVTVRDPHEVTEAMVRAFIEIRSVADLSIQLTVIETAMAPA